MAKSVRLSDDLYSLARYHAALMHRSVGQQIEHWAAIGQALEERGDLGAQREAVIAHLRARDHDRVRRGKVKAKDLHFIPTEWIREATVIWPKDAFAEYWPED
jgi:hypothetical protein